MSCRSCSSKGLGNKSTMNYSSNTANTRATNPGSFSTTGLNPKTDVAYIPKNTRKI